MRTPGSRAVATVLRPAPAAQTRAGTRVAGPNGHRGYYPALQRSAVPAV